MDPARRRHDGSHGPGCFGCKVRSIQLSPSATPSRRNSIPPREATRPSNSWEKGILRDERGLPVTRNGKVIPIKQAAAERHKIEAQLRQLKQGKDPALI